MLNLNNANGRPLVALFCVIICVHSALSLPSVIRIGKDFFLSVSLSLQILNDLNSHCKF